MSDYRLSQRTLQMMQEPVLRRAVAAACLVAVFSACSGQASSAAGASAQAATAPAPAAVVSAQPAPLAGGRSLPDFASLVERFGPAVVNVAVVGRSEPTAGGGAPGLSPDDPLNDFFRRFGLPQQQPRGNAPPARGEGSGFIVSPDGYIMTNAHVVDGAAQVTVKLTDRREYSAKVIGADKRSDVAVLKIDVKGLPTVRIGDPSKLRPGEWVVAIG